MTQTQEFNVENLYTSAVDSKPIRVSGWSMSEAAVTHAVDDNGVRVEINSTTWDEHVAENQIDDDGTLPAGSFTEEEFRQPEDFEARGSGERGRGTSGGFLSGVIAQRGRGG